MSTRLVQLSDCHLFTDTEQEIRGVQSHDALVQALEHVTEHQSNCDYLVISGLNLANSPPFFKILPRCPSISPASWGDRTGLCYDPADREPLAPAM